MATSTAFRSPAPAYQFPELTAKASANRSEVYKQFSEDGREVLGPISGSTEVFEVGGYLAGIKSRSGEWEDGSGTSYPDILIP